MEYIEGIILKKINYKESSKIIYLYTETGLRSILIHGSNKMKSPYLSLSKVMNFVGLHVSGKELLTLRDGDIIKRYPISSNSLEKYTYLSHISELIYNFSNHEHDHEKLLKFLLKIFDIVEEREDYIPYINMIELKLLYLLGVNPIFTHCTSCENTDNLLFSVTEGGMCCPLHIKNPINVSEAAIESLKELYYFDLSKQIITEIDEKILREIRFVLDKYYEYHLNFRSNSRKMLMGLIGY
ncbi:DNA repair protein RecO [Mycoplasmatota bacterium WC30]